MNQTIEFAIIGGGIAGASIGAHLAAHGSVRLFEMEDQPGYHSTGRSAALFMESYGNDQIRRITRASRNFFFNPPRTFTEASLVKPRPVMVIATSDQETSLAHIREMAGGTALELTPAEASRLCPILNASLLTGALLIGSTADIEVHELHHGYLRMLKERGGLVSAGAPVLTIARESDYWRIRTATDDVRAQTIINASGAWVDEVAEMANVRPIGIVPKRRTVCLIDPPNALEVEGWPMVIDADEQFYVKPDAGKLLLSPADETPTPPTDAQPEDIDVAIAVDRLEQVTTMRVGRISHRWAGLRNFVEDHTPVVGPDPEQPNFFWHAALGGYGIQTAPALSRVAASLVLGKPIDSDIAAFGVDTEALSPARLDRESRVRWQS